MEETIDKISNQVKSADMAQLAEVAAEKAISYSVQLALALALITGGFIVARIVTNAIRQRLLAIRGFDKTLVPMLAQTAHYGIIFFTFMLVLANFGIETTSIIAVLGAAGLAIGLALQGTLQNVAAGIMLLIIRPFRVGDSIEAGSAKGTVDEIGLFMTKMQTPQGVFIAVPNSMLWSNMITNYSKLPRRRFDLLVGVSYDADVDEARDLLLKLLSDDARVHKSPEPLVVVRSLGESSVDIELRAWVDRTNYWAVNFDITRKVKLVLDEAGISIPYPHRQLILPVNVENLMSGPAVESSGTENKTQVETGSRAPKKKSRARNIPV